MTDIDWGKVPFAQQGTLWALSGACTYNQAKALFEQREIDARTWDWYRLLWVWSCYRLSDTEDACARQNRYLARAGVLALERRFARIKRLGQAKLAKSAGPYRSL